MKVEVKKQVYKCDFCRKTVDYANECKKCGRHCCFDCEKNNGITYTHAVFFRGSGDAFYCNDCDGELRSRINKGQPKDPLHSAFVAIKDFKIRIDEQSERDKAEMERLESNLKRFNVY